MTSLALQLDGGGLGICLRLTIGGEEQSLAHVTRSARCE